LNIEKLLRKSAEGNKKSQKHLYDQFVDILFSTILRYVKNEYDAEDILLQAFLKIFQKLKDFEYLNDRAFVGWLKRIAINEALMFKRKSLSMVYKLDDENELQYENTVIPDFMEEKDLLKVIEDLPDGYKTVFLLHVVDGYSHKEIGENLNIAEGTSRSQFFKARNLLQSKLSKSYGQAIG